MKAFLGKVGGRKFILAIISVVVMVLNGALGLDIPESTVQVVGGIVAAFLLGQGLADGMSGGSTSTSAE